MAVLRSRTRNKGFSFLELLLCVAILAASGLAVLQAFSLALRLQSRGADLLAASALAEEKLQELSFLESRKGLTPLLAGRAGEERGFAWSYSFVNETERGMWRMDLSLR